MEKEENEKKEEKPEKLNLDEVIETKEEKDMENKPKSKQSQIYFYIPLILSSFSYMCLNSLNYMIQIDSEYIIKINNNLENSKLDKNKTIINQTSQYFIISILFINILSKSLGHLILNAKLFIKKIDLLLIISNIFSLFTNMLFFFKNMNTKFIFLAHSFNAFTSGLFFVTLLRLNWSFLPLNEGFVSGIFTGFEYFSIIYLSLFYKIIEFKYLFLVNSIFLVFSFISILFIKLNFKGFYLGKSSDLEINFETKEQNKNNDKNLEENLIKKGEIDIKNDINNDDVQEEKEEKIEQFETDMKDEENSFENNEKYSLFIQNLYADISSHRFILLIIAYFLLLFSNYILSIIYLPFSIILNLNMYFDSSNQLIIYVFIYFISSIFFGISFDLKMVRTLVIRLIFLSVLTIILFFPTKYFSYFIDLLSIINAVCLSGIKSIIYPLVYREFFNNEENYYLISIFLIVEIIIYMISPYILKIFIFDLADFIMIFITCIGMLFGGYYIMIKKLFPLIIIDTNENYDLNTKKGQGLKQLHLQDELPPLSKE
jgi:hypothetical protein